MLGITTLKDVQNKTMMTYHSTSLRRAVIQGTNRSCRRHKRKGFSCWKLHLHIQRNTIWARRSKQPKLAWFQVSFPSKKAHMPPSFLQPKGSSGLRALLLPQLPAITEVLDYPKGTASVWGRLLAQWPLTQPLPIWPQTRLTVGWI